MNKESMNGYQPNNQNFMNNNNQGIAPSSNMAPNNFQGNNNNGNQIMDFGFPDMNQQFRANAQNQEQVSSQFNSNNNANPNVWNQTMAQNNQSTDKSKQPPNPSSGADFEDGERNEDDYGDDSDSDSGHSSYSSMSKETPSTWDPKNDKQLMKLAQTMSKNWKKIAKEFNDSKITPKFCKYRYKRLRNGQQQSTKTRFTHYEDLTIVKYYKKYGSNWEAISKFLVNRTASMVKNRFYSNIKKKGKVEAFLEEIDRLQVPPEELLRKDKSGGKEPAQSHEQPSMPGSAGFDGARPLGMEMMGGNMQNHHHHSHGDGNNNGMVQGMDFMQNNQDFFNFENEFLNSYGNTFKDADIHEKFFENPEDGNQTYGNNLFQGLMNPKSNSVAPEEFIRKKTQDKINMLRTKVSSIQNLFQQTKHEIEKIQNSFKIEN